MLGAHQAPWNKWAYSSQTIVRGRSWDEEIPSSDLSGWLGEPDLWVIQPGIEAQPQGNILPTALRGPNNVALLGTVWFPASGRNAHGSVDREGPLIAGLGLSRL